METGCFNVVTAYHIVNKDRLLYLHHHELEQKAKRSLEQLFASKGVKDHGYDSIAAAPDSPEEYCFALRHQGRRPVLKKSNLKSFTEFCQKLQVVENPDRPLLLKNPFDTNRFLFIHRMFPEAGFIFIHRNPVDVIDSQIRAIRSVLQQRNEYLALMDQRYRKVCERPWKLAIARAVYSDRLPLLGYQVSRNLARNCDYILCNYSRLGSAATGLTYRELCQAPTQTVRRILKFFGLCEPSPQDYSRFINPRSGQLTDEVKKRRHMIESRNADYSRVFGV